MTASLAGQAVFAKSAQKLPGQRMRALVRSGRRVSVETLTKPPLTDDRCVVVRVTLAGLCRTDLYAAEGRIKVCDPLVLGHEFCGVVDQVGSSVESVKPGQRVTVNPLLPCGNCDYCRRGRASSCQHSTFIGIDRAGCFAGFIVVPAQAVYALPENVSELAAAYAEPVAASLAVLKAEIQPGQRGLIYGRNRFSQLLEKILQVHGISDVTVCDAGNAALIEPSGFDYVIETAMTASTFTDVARAVKPGGKIILKSRQHESVPFVMTDLLKKEPVLHVVNYGPFEEALDLLVSGRVAVDDLVDGIYKLDDFERVLAAARHKEALKPFFAPWQE